MNGVLVMVALVDVGVHEPCSVHRRCTVVVSHIHCPRTWCCHCRGITALVRSSSGRF